MRFELFVATRYLRAKRRQAFIGVITAISIAGVAAGVASLIVALAINNGFRQDLQDRLLGSTAHISLMRVQSDGIKDWRPLLERFSKQPHVIAAAPAIYEKVLISRGPRASGAVLKGMIPAEERKVSDLLKSITIGSANDLEESLPSVGSDLRGEQSASVGSGLRPGQRGSETRLPTSPDLLSGVQQRVAAMPPIIPGKDMADALGATVGSVVLVTSPQGELTPFGMVRTYIRFRVVGIFNSGFFDYDTSWAFTWLSDAQRLFGLGDVVSTIEFKIDDKKTRIENSHHSKTDVLGNHAEGREFPLRAGHQNHGSDSCAESVGHVLARNNGWHRGNALLDAGEQVGGRWKAGL